MDDVGEVLREYYRQKPVWPNRKDELIVVQVEVVPVEQNIRSGIGDEIDKENHRKCP